MKKIKCGNEYIFLHSIQSYEFISYDDREIDIKKIKKFILKIIKLRDYEVDGIYDLIEKNEIFYCSTYDKSGLPNIYKKHEFLKSRVIKDIKQEKSKYLIKFISGEKQELLLDKEQVRILTGSFLWES